MHGETVKFSSFPVFYATRNPQLFLRQEDMLVGTVLPTNFIRNGVHRRMLSYASYPVTAVRT
jgi:hypothetical protein